MSARVSLENDTLRNAPYPHPRFPHTTTQLKKRVETCEANFEINSAAIDDMNGALTETVKVLNDTLKKELAKMVTKDEFKGLEDKHNTLKNRVDELEKDIKERLERMIKECMAKIEVLTERIESVEEKVERVRRIR